MAEEKVVSVNEQSVPVQEAVESTPEVIPSMDDFKDEITKSFHKFKSDDLVKGVIIGISETEVTVDIEGGYTDAVIKATEMSNDPHFSIKADVAIGDSVQAVVLRESKEGTLLLSKKKADDLLAWDTLEDMMQNRTVAQVKVSQAVKGGVVTYLNGVRAFIPASQISNTYVENLETVVGQELKVVVITVDKEAKKLVCSAKELLREEAKQERKSKLSSVAVGTILPGKVDKLMPFGAFIDLGDHLSGLVHVSEISYKRVKQPSDVLKEGEEVTVKVIAVKDGKLSLSIKALEEKPEFAPRDARDSDSSKDEGPRSYSDGKDATTGLGELLKGIKLK